MLWKILRWIEVLKGPNVDSNHEAQMEFYCEFQLKRTWRRSQFYKGFLSELNENGYQRKKLLMRFQPIWRVLTQWEFEEIWEWSQPTMKSRWMNSMGIRGDAQLNWRFWRSRVNSEDWRVAQRRNDLEELNWIQDTFLFNLRMNWQTSWTASPSWDKVSRAKPLGEGDCRGSRCSPVLGTANSN